MIEHDTSSEYHSNHSYSAVNDVPETDCSTIDSGRLIVRIVLSGEEKHSVRADAVANIICAISTLIRESTYQMKCTEEIETRVSNFQKGSLIIPFDLIIPIIGYIYGTIDIINDSIDFVRNFFKIKMALSGKTFKDESDFNKIKQQAITEGNISNSNNISYNVYNNCTINNYISQATSELSNDSTVDSIEISQPNNASERVIIPREKFPDFNIPEAKKVEERDKTTRTIETELTIISPNFKKGKWKVVYENKQISVLIKDNTFRENVEKRRISFKAGDRLRARLEIVMKYDPMVSDFIIDETKYCILEVMAVIYPPENEDDGSKKGDITGENSLFDSYR